MDDPESAAPVVPGRVLVVEDDPVQSKMMRAAIEKMGPGWEVDAAASGAECLQALETRTFAVVLLDMVLPGGSGLDVLRGIRQRGWVVPVIMVTAHGGEATAVEALRLGVLDYVKKEEGYLQDLGTVIRRAVDTHRERLGQISRYSRLRLELARRTHCGVIDSFTAPIVHDIRNPLARISFIAEILMQNRAADAELCRGLSQVVGCVEAVDKLLERLARYARQEFEEHVVLDLADFVRGIVRAEDEQLRFQNVRLAMRVPDQPVRILAAPSGLQQVLLNLIANATQVLVDTRGGGTVELDLSADERHARLTVMDDGPGIPPSILADIFKPGVTYGRGGKGTGLGLAIVDSVVREHGGRVEAVNMPEAGARFTIRLPLADFGPVALVLEDEESVQELFRSQLATLGVRAEVYGDGRLALERLRDGVFDLLVLDIRTPGIDGLAIMETLITSRPELARRSMIVSGCIEDRSLQDLVSRYPIPCLPKPYSVHDFNDIVRLLLRRPEGTAPG